EAGLPEVEVGIWHGLYAPAGTPQPVIEKLSAALAEAGLPEVEVGIWHGLYAPAGTPQPVIEKLSAAL
ncbi:hypothetical protein CNY89_30735, partial [Amaricoccus sp. HAR-UPW-R2A-40]